MDGNRSCKEFIPLDKTDKQTNCVLCTRWNPRAEKCREMIWLKEWVAEPEDTREIESLMRHDAYRRDHGGIRQIRRG